MLRVAFSKQSLSASTLSRRMLPSINSKPSLSASPIEAATATRIRSELAEDGERPLSSLFERIVPNRVTPCAGALPRGSRSGGAPSSAQPAGRAIAETAQQQVSAPPSSTDLSLVMDQLDAHLAAMLEERQRHNEAVTASLLPSEPIAGTRQQALRLVTQRAAATAAAEPERQGTSLGFAQQPPESKPVGALFSAERGPISVAGARWGVSEGGIDGLGWVRNLINMTEATHPIRAEPAASASAAGSVEAFKRNPLLKTARREDVALLQSWLDEMMKQVRTFAFVAYCASDTVVPH